MAKLLEFSPGVAKAPFFKYQRFNPQVFRQAAGLAKRLRGKKIVHINATANGGGVAELLHSQVRLERSLRLDSRWFYIHASKEFFDVTKKLHDLLQGMKGGLTAKERQIYLSTNRRMEKLLAEVIKSIRPDVVVFHDPQPLPLVRAVPKGLPAVLRFHGDLSQPNKQALSFLNPFLSHYAAVILSSKHYKVAFLRTVQPEKLKVIMPAIDPLAKKNLPMGEAYAGKILEKFGINVLKPILSQVSRFDPWKDPLGVIKAFYDAKAEIPDLQLILAGFMQAQDDPEAKRVFEEVKKLAGGDEEIFLFSELSQLKGTDLDIFISAVYTASTVVMQKSLKEGFGLTVTEAMWKGKAVIAGRAEGPKLQIKNRHNGLLVYSPEQAAKAVVKLVKNKRLREKLGRVACHSVKKRFLLPRFILDNLRVYTELIST